MDCLFCALIAGEIPSKRVYEDDAALAFLDIAPWQEGHTVVVPKRHTVDVLADDDALAEIAPAVARVGRLLKERLGADQLGLGFATIVESHLDFVGRFHDMVIGQHQTIGRNHHAAPQSRLALALDASPIAEKMPEQRVVAKRIAPHLLAGKDMHHRRQGRLRGIGESNYLTRIAFGIGLLNGDHARLGVGLAPGQPFRLEGLHDKQGGDTNRDGLGKNEPQSEHGETIERGRGKCGEKS